MFENEQADDVSTQDLNATESTEVSATGEQAEVEKPLESLDYEKGTKLSEKLTKNPELEDVLDLEKVQKFKWNGKVLTAKELKSMAMMQSDYTKKTQELSENRKYFRNLSFDLAKVKENPSLADEFRKIYPKGFHKDLEEVLGSIETQEQKPAVQMQQQTPKAPVADDTPQSKPEKAPLDPRIDELYNNLVEQRQTAALEKVDALFDRLTSKYPNADEGKIIARVQSLIELSKKDSNVARPDEKAIEKLFKSDNEQFETKLKEAMDRALKDQKQANAMARGPAVGGATPGTAPRVARTIKEATALAMSDPSLQ